MSALLGLAVFQGSSKTHTRRESTLPAPFMEHFDITPSLFKTAHPPVRVSVVHEGSLSSAQIAKFLLTEKDGMIGLAPVYGTKCALAAIAFATVEEVLFIRVASSRNHGTRRMNGGRRLLLEHIFLNPNFIKCGFKMDTLSVGLYRDLGIQIVNAVDMLSLSNSSRDSPQAGMDALGGEKGLHKVQVEQLLRDEESNSTLKETTALQAWAVCQAASLPNLQANVKTLTRIDTKARSKVHLDLISDVVRNAQRFEQLKPRRTHHEIKPTVIQKKGGLQVVCQRFKTRVMPTGHNQIIEVEQIINGKRFISKARTTEVNGRSVSLALKGSSAGPGIKSITTVGKESATRAESLRAQIMLTLLQGTITLLENPFVRRVLIPSASLNWNGVVSAHMAPAIIFSARKLNVSQQTAVQAILSVENDRRVVLIQGPPGTGKTTVIAAATTSLIKAPRDGERTVWLVAQSNVAVKNIAEKLADVEFFEFNILVSKDFHHDWHEHLYGKILRNLIRSDDFAPTRLGAARQLQGHRVILCTLSMLSHDRLAPYCAVVPPQTLIFDEASQIEVGDYFPMFYRFKETILKLVFIGDDKQLPPYGQSDIDGLKSIFQMRHLLSSAVLLDIQYRMPIPIGEFISKNVYDSRLQSHHSITSPSCCRFIDVLKSREISSGKSWRNDEEIKIVIALAKSLHSRGLSYKIITPYDPQRSRLEVALQAARIPHDDKCFNVDSFQGNEDDYIIISLVRSHKLGFLSQRRRMNVMLTRCKKAMFICTSRSFIHSVASRSLVGELASELGKSCWVSSTKILNNAFRVV